MRAGGGEGRELFHQCLLLAERQYVLDVLGRLTTMAVKLL